MIYRYISSQWLGSSHPGLLLIHSDSITSLMVNEEDHLRFQAVLPGLQMRRALHHVSAAADDFAGRLGYAQSLSAGYLAASPANCGSGLRIACIAHLQGLTQTGRLAGLLGAVVRTGCTVRGVFGEQSVAVGALYQVSNICTAERDTVAIAERVQAAVEFLVMEERQARHEVEERSTGSRTGEIELEAAMFRGNPYAAVQAAALMRLESWTAHGKLNVHQADLSLAAALGLLAAYSIGDDAGRAEAAAIVAELATNYASGRPSC